MQRTVTRTLVMSLMLFPHFVETIYSPALHAIASGFSVSTYKASQTISCYFFAFALGIVIWGYLCDRIGRRPTILLGLMLYAIASFAALFADGHFTFLLLMRALYAFGAAVGSIGAQTVLRDQFTQTKLTQAFSIIGMLMPLSPALGILIGSVLTNDYGYQSVFTALASLAAILLLYISLRFPETRPQKHQMPTILPTIKRMLADKYIWRSALLIALFNLCLFSYYQLAPFLFHALNLPSDWLGYTGIFLVVGMGLGSGLNRLLSVETQAVQSACLFTFIGGMCVYLLQESVWFVMPMLLVTIAYGLAIPHLLAQALRDYQKCIGSAGAFLGLMYYMLLAVGLIFSGWLQNLGVVLVISSLFLGAIAWSFEKKQTRF